jgi:hypothetical protein
MVKALDGFSKSCGLRKYTRTVTTRQSPCASPAPGRASSSLLKCSINANEQPTVADARAPAYQPEAPGITSRTTSIPNAVLRLRQALGMHLALGRLFATDIAELAYWITQAGVPGLSDMAMDPQSYSFSKNAARKVAAVLQINAIEEEFSRIPVPNILVNERRQLHLIPVIPLQDVLMEEFMAAPEEVLQSLNRLNTINWQNNAIKQACDKSGSI